MKSWTVSVRIDSSVLINKPHAMSYCANCTLLYSLFAHMCQSICYLLKSIRNSQSDENKRLIVQRSDRIVSRAKKRIEPKQLRKTANAKV